LILGNHDHHIENNRILPNVYESDALISKFCDGKPNPAAFQLKIKAQELFSSVQHYKEITIEKQKIILCHYAMRVWNHSHKGSWMLYGHSHGTLDEMTPEIANPTWIGDQYYIKNYKTMDVGVDTYDLHPYLFEEIKDIMDKKDVLLEVDHHDKTR
jgi:calcineurin-like phosphoesterase family protein